MAILISWGIESPIASTPPPLSADPLIIYTLMGDELSAGTDKFAIRTKDNQHVVYVTPNGKPNFDGDANFIGAYQIYTKDDNNVYFCPRPDDEGLVFSFPYRSIAVPNV